MSKKRCGFYKKEIELKIALLKGFSRDCLIIRPQEECVSCLEIRPKEVETEIS